MCTCTCSFEGDPTGCEDVRIGCSGGKGFSSCECSCSSDDITTNGGFESGTCTGESTCGRRDIDGSEITLE